MIFQTPPPDFNKRFDVVGCLVLHADTFIVLKRLAQKANGGKWGLPAGKVDPGENLESAVLREVQEETGLTLHPGEVALFKSMPVRDGSFDIDWHLFVTKFDAQPDVRISDSEHSEYRWVTLNEAFQLDLIHDLKESLEIYFGLV